MKKKYKKIIIWGSVLFPILLMTYFLSKEHIHTGETRKLRVYNIDNKLIIFGMFETVPLPTNSYLSSSDYYFKDGKLIIRLYNRLTFTKSFFYKLYIPVSKIPDEIYIEDGNGELKEYPLTQNDSKALQFDSNKMGEYVVAKKRE